MMLAFSNNSLLDNCFWTDSDYSTGRTISQQCKK